MRGPNKKPEPNSESEMVGHVFLRFCLLCFLMLLQGLTPLPRKRLDFAVLASGEL